MEARLIARNLAKFFGEDAILMLAEVPLRFRLAVRNELRQLLPNLSF